MKLKLNQVVCAGLLGSAALVSCAQAHATDPRYIGGGEGWPGIRKGQDPYSVVFQFIYGLVVGADHGPRGMVICNDAHSQELCRVGLINGDLENLDYFDPAYGWLLRAGAYSPPPYVGNTPDSHVLAMPGKGSAAIVGAMLPAGSTSPAEPKHSYTVRLRARGSGALPAAFKVQMAAAGSESAPVSVRILAQVTHSVGWEWTDIDLRVDGVVRAEPTALFVGLERTDNNASTMLQIDDVRIERTPLSQSDLIR